MTAFLLAMQAAGLVTSIFSSQGKQKFIKLGQQLEQEQFSTNIQALRLESAESSLDEIKQLRQNISSQIAINAARGNRGGSSYWTQNESVKNFENDERKRRMNLLAKESNLRAAHVLSGFQTLQSESQLGQALTSEVLKTIPVSSLLSPSKNKSKNTDSGFSWGIE
jgi:hypothetical protein